ncbi:MAG TPA: N-acetylmuramoyl-L-alanine amidase [Allocoleopsis sp.]
MARIFISAGHGAGDSGAMAGGTTEAKEMILLRDQILPELRTRGLEVLSVPDDRTLVQTIQWINDRARKGDIALEIHADAFDNPGVRGASIFYISNNTERKNHAELVLLALLRRVPQLPNRGAKPDTSTGVGRLGFCRDINIPSMLLEVGFLTNPDDRNLIQNRRKEMAQGIADGLAAWSRALTGNTGNTGNAGNVAQTYPEINININNQTYPEKGILINNNSYIPVDLVDRLQVKLTPNIRRIQYRGLVYIKAIELRDFNISVGWDANTQTLIVRSILQIHAGLIDRIVGNGYTSEVQLMMFLKSNNEKALANFPDLAKLYREEGGIEGINYDIAFCQMCLETNFLRFGGDVQPMQNNFAGLGTVGGGIEGASFPSARIGVRAHIQHLKAYASLEPLVQELVDPRFRFVTRGVAPLIDLLSGRWAADLQYGTKISALLKRLYEAANLM